MDTPEPPTVWPPAPTLPPPEIIEKPKFSLRLPDWANFWYSVSLFLYLTVEALNYFSKLGFGYHPHWDTFPVRIGSGFVLGSFLTARKYGPKRWLVKK